MIAVLKGERGGLEKISELSPNIWVNVVNPGADEITRLQRELGIPYDFLVAALDVDEKARTDREEDVRLILLRVPYFQGQSVDVPIEVMVQGIRPTR